MLNSVVLAGNLGGDPEIHFNSEGEPIASFNHAFRAGKKKTGWIKATCFNRLSEICEKHRHKGAKIAVSGVLAHHQRETNEGVKRNAIQMIANNIEFIKTDGRGFEEGEGHENGTPF
ncbi:MAG: single-stranded DNA-binding protein [Hyphomicrobiales bacterium]